MNEDTKIIPAITAGSTVYTTRTRRFYNAVNRVRYFLARRVAAAVPDEDSRTAAVLYRLDDMTEGIRLWWGSLRAAYRYTRSAKHKRRIFATDTVTGKLRRERYVNRSTPAAQRTYVEYSVFDDGLRWDEETHEIARRMRREQKNSLLVLSGAEGPLER